MTLTTSLFSPKSPTNEESVNGTDSGNEDSDQVIESRVINVENGEVEPPQVDSSIPIPSNTQGTEEVYVEGTLDGRIEGVIHEDQDQQTESENPIDRLGESIQELTEEQLLGSTYVTQQSDKGETTTELDGQPVPEANTPTPIQSSELERNESEVREEETDNSKDSSGEQTDNQNNLKGSDNIIDVRPEEVTKSEEERNVEDEGGTEDKNQILGSTNVLNATYTKIPSDDLTDVGNYGESDTSVIETDGRASTQNQISETIDDRSLSSRQNQLVGDESENPPENNSELVEESSQSGETQDATAQNQMLDQMNDGVLLEDVNATDSKPSSSKSRMGTAQSRPANKNSGEEMDDKNGDNSTLERQLEETEEYGGENDKSLGISKDMEDPDDSGSAVRSGQDSVEVVDGVATLGSQVELQENVEASLPDSTVEITKEEGFQEPQPTDDGKGEDSELLDRPITTRSAGGSRAEILAITPAPPEEDDVTEDDDQKAVGGTEEEDRAKAEELVAAGDMESMAEMVLNGRGSALLNMTSPNADVQLFINNIPQYIAKIERVHVAAREGDLRGVQTALDRRKFAVARDNSTPLKPTPLHVAALFGRTSVLRYLAGRFPETMHARDAGGRTALHYAATLPDNGHFYSLLVTLGADKSIIDNEGRTAEYYLKNKGDLSRDELLNEYQNRPVPIDTTGLNFNRFSDKGAELIKGGYPIFNPEEGQYLADSLGEPLIKGLTDVAHVRPKNPVVHLANFLLVYNKPEEGGTNNTRLPSAKRAVTAGMEEAPPSGVADANQEEQIDESDQLEDEEPMGTEETAEPEGEEERDREELEDKEDEEETLDEDNASVGEDPPEPVEPAFKPTNRDEHGQTVLHFAAARSHGRNAIFQLLQEMEVNIGLRDGLYRTARDISEQMEITENVQGLDKYVVALAARGDNDKLTELLLEGYDHILDAEDGKNIIDVAKDREHAETVALLQSITAFEERREKLIRAIRFGSMRQVRELFREAPNKRHLAIAKNQQGRCSLHVAVLTQHENIVEYIAQRFPATLHIGDNLMRAPLHYAMGVDKVEPLSRILIAAGAERVVKDLKGRQPSYYFMSKTDIQKLQDEEEGLRV